jgi:hypothetical protein
MIDSSIPQPKVKEMREEDSELARIIEDMIRDELNRLPMEELNDQMERIVPINGGGFWLVEWDSSSNKGKGGIAINALQPKMILPQAGIYSSIDDMDYIIIRISMTANAVNKRYGINVKDEGESAPEIKTIPGKNTINHPGEVTLNKAYYRNESGGIGVFSWVNNIIIEDFEDYQVRLEKVCKTCETPQEDYEVCPICGGKEFKTRKMEFETFNIPQEGQTPFGTVEGQTGGMGGGIDEVGAPPAPMDGEMGEIQGVVGGGMMFPQSIDVEVYSPSSFPIVMQKNVSVFGQLLGESDVEKIKDQQNMISRLELKIEEKLISSGSILLLPADSRLKQDTRDSRVYYAKDVAAISQAKSIDFESNVSQDISVLEAEYEAARKILGITDSFQGRHDTTATSGVAKQFAAAQSAGRLESRRVMKRAAWSHMFELIFKSRLAYTNEPLKISRTDEQGQQYFGEFRREDFLVDDGSGNMEWNDNFLFSCDSDTPLAANREARWAEMYNFLQSNAFDVNNPGVKVMWQEMKRLHYPGAYQVIQALEKLIQEQQQAQQQQQQAQQQQAQKQQGKAFELQERAQALNEQEAQMNFAIKQGKLQIDAEKLAKEQPVQNTYYNGL